MGRSEGVVKVSSKYAEIITENITKYMYNKKSIENVKWCYNCVNTKMGHLVQKFGNQSTKLTPFLFLTCTPHCPTL